MNFYHGTTLRNAVKIAEIGFLPRKGAVWSPRVAICQGRASKRVERAAHRCPCL